MQILIPAYKPSHRLPALLRELGPLCPSDTGILVVDDGSGPDCEPIFSEIEKLGAAVLHHGENRGKGMALKTGFAALQRQGGTEGVVCADCDGQHSAKDISKILREAQRQSPAVILGARKFTGAVPVRSLFGNRITAKTFSLCTGLPLIDTQTGLRAYPSELFGELCQIPGKGYEYEMNVLLRLKSLSWPIREVGITTIYEEKNRSSHFRPILDSLRVFWPLLKFSLSSIVAGILDFGLLFFFSGLLGELLPAVIFSRGISSVFNYTCNRCLVFGGRTKGPASAPKYFLTVFLIMALNYCLLHSLTEAGMYLFPAKILTEGCLFFFSYLVQKKIVFTH